MTSASFLNRPRRVLPALLATVVALPAVTLIVLGLRLLEQDRALARQRRVETLQASADRAVRATEHQVAGFTSRLADAGAPAEAPRPGQVRVEWNGDTLHVAPDHALAWFPDGARLPEPPTDVFADADQREFPGADPTGALSAILRFTESRDPAIRTGALLREARLRRKLGQQAEAVRAYERMAEITTVAVNGAPADLVARQALCAIARASGSGETLRRLGSQLQDDVNAGRWRIDRSTYDLLQARLDTWVGSIRPRSQARESASWAVDWIDGERRRGALAPSGVRAVPPSGRPAVLAWHSTGGRLVAEVLLPAFIEREWEPAVARAAAPALVALISEPPAVAGPLTGTGAFVQVLRRGAEAGLPLSVMVTLTPGIAVDNLAARERTLLTALAAVLLLAAAGAYLVVRWRNQELALSRLQSDFVAAVSHEFRTPLTSLQQFNELLEHAEDLPPEKARAYRQAQARATERLRRLVESLLDFGRMEAGRRPFNFEPVDAGALVRDIVDEFRGEMDGRGFEIRCRVVEGDLRIEADTEALGRAIWNLLDNAVKYSGESREVEVTVGAADGGVQGTRMVTVSVRDRGIGIPRSEQARIFQKFARGAAATAARIKGTGIGLTMAQHIVVAHRGRIRVECEPGSGSTFTIEVPAAEQAADSGARR